VGPDDPPGSPGGSLRAAQDPYVGGLFASLLETLEARRVVVISGPEYWRFARQDLAFLTLPRQEFPLIQGGQTGDGRTLVVGYHPTYARRKHVGAAAYAARIVEAVRAIEGAAT
jgi:hypothetical protein